MKRAKVKIPAKINLTLDVEGVENDYHKIKSLVSNVNIFDTIYIKKRKDNNITLKFFGIDPKCDILENNAYKSAKLFIDKFSVGGVDIVVKKNIPLSSGLGGSSADIAGVLLAMKKLFKVKESIFDLANELGSDSGYMSIGGYAVISNRGEEVVKIDTKIKIPAIVITDEKTISAFQGYNGYDQMGIDYEGTTIQSVSALKNKKKEFFSLLKNDLEPYAISVIPDIENKKKDLIKAKANASLMTGSGSAVYGLFTSKKQRNNAYKLLKQKYKDSIIKCKTM